MFFHLAFINKLMSFPCEVGAGVLSGRRERDACAIVKFYSFYLFSCRQLLVYICIAFYNYFLTIYINVLESMTCSIDIN